MIGPIIYSKKLDINIIFSYYWYYRYYFNNKFSGSIMFVIALIIFPNYIKIIIIIIFYNIAIKIIFKINTIE